MAYLATQANKTQLKVEKDPTDGLLYQKLGSHGNEFWSVLTNVTKEPKVSLPEQGSQSVK